MKDDYIVKDDYIALLEAQNQERRALTEHERAARRRSNIRFLICCVVLFISIPFAYFSPFVTLLVASTSMVWLTFERRSSLRQIAEDSKEREALDETQRQQRIEKE